MNGRFLLYVGIGILCANTIADTLDTCIPVNIAHRGAINYAPENTLASFRKALELGVDMVECDVQLSKSKDLVVIHDNTLERTTDGNGYVKDKTLVQLKALDAGNKERIPTLEEVLDIIDKKAVVNIELKAKKTAKPVFRLLKSKGWSYDDFIVSSFRYDELTKMRKLSKDVRLGLFVHDISDDDIVSAVKIGAFSINPNISSLDQDFVDISHNCGLKVYAWAVNDSIYIEKARSLCVDGVFTDCPGRILEY